MGKNTAKMIPVKTLYQIQSEATRHHYPTSFDTRNNRKRKERVH